MAGKRRIPLWHRAFLRALARTGNVRVAAFEAGVDKVTAYNHRRTDAGFAAKWAATVEKFKAMGARMKRPLHHPSDGPPPRSGEELVLRRTKHGAKLVRAAAGRWSRRTEEIFLAELGRTGCVRAAAKAAGISTGALYERRKNYPEFGERWAEVEAAAGARIPGLLTAATIASLDPEQAGRGKRRGRGALPKVNVDQAIRIAALKGGRETKRDRRAETAARQRKHQRSKEELTQSLLKGLAVLRKRKLALGWIETPEGQLIPPGWVYVGTGGG